MSKHGERLRDSQVTRGREEALLGQESDNLCGVLLLDPRPTGWVARLPSTVGSPVVPAPRPQKPALACVYVTNPSVFLKHGDSLLDLICLLSLQVLPGSSPSSHACPHLPHAHPGLRHAVTARSWMLSLPRGEALTRPEGHAQV